MLFQIYKSKVELLSFTPVFLLHLPYCEDLETAFDRVPREVTRWALMKAKVEEWLVKAIMAMYEGAQTVVRTTEGDSKAFNVKVG